MTGEEVGLVGEFAAVMKAHGLAELEIQEGGLRLRLVLGPAPVPPAEGAGRVEPPPPPKDAREARRELMDEVFGG